METVDVTGEVCPRPALIVRRRLTDMESGEELLVRGDYPPAEENLTRTCEKHGYAVTAAGDSGDEGETDSATDRFELCITVTEDASL